MKNLYLPVHCCNEYLDESPTMVHIQLSDKMVERIVMLSSCIAQAKSYKMSEFFGMEFYDVYGMEVEDGEFNPDMLSPEFLKENTGAYCRTELDMIHVVNRFDDQYAVYFTSIPKHCGDSEKLSTEWIDIVDIMSNDVINNIEY